MKFDDVKVGDVFFCSKERRAFIVTYKLTKESPNHSPILCIVWGDGCAADVSKNYWDTYLNTKRITHLTHYDRIILKGESDDR